MHTSISPWAIFVRLLAIRSLLYASRLSAVLLAMFCSACAPIWRPMVRPIWKSLIYVVFSHRIELYMGFWAPEKLRRASSVHKTSKTTFWAPHTALSRRIYPLIGLWVRSDDHAELWSGSSSPAPDPNALSSSEASIGVQKMHFCAFWGQFQISAAQAMRKTLYAKISCGYASSLCTVLLAALALRFGALWSVRSENRWFTSLFRIESSSTWVSERLWGSAGPLACI